MNQSKKSSLVKNDLIYVKKHTISCFSFRHYLSETQIVNGSPLEDFGFMVMMMLSAMFATSDMAETKTKPKKFVINHKTFCWGEDMAAIKTLPASTQGERSSIENCIGSWKDKFNQILSEVLN